jgi:hypothetical protein
MAARADRRSNDRRSTLRGDRTRRAPLDRTFGDNRRSPSRLRGTRECQLRSRRVDARIRDFYENTARYRLDTWATAYFPARIALWLLVATISRRVQQLDLPLDGLDTARGITSEIILLRDSTGAVRYTGWFRRRLHDGRVLFTGFYMTQRIPRDDLPCVKAVFPSPMGAPPWCCVP